MAFAGSSPARAAARSIVFQDWFRDKRVATSWFDWIFAGVATTPGSSELTRSARMFESSSLSRHEGALKVVPPPARKPSSAGSRTTTPESTRAVFCSVRVRT
jgi:hypothetical protein